MTVTFLSASLLNMIIRMHILSGWFLCLRTYHLFPLSSFILSIHDDWWHYLTITIEFPDIPPPPLNNAPASVRNGVVANRGATAQPADQLPVHRSRRPARTPGLVGTNAAFLVPDNIRKKFREGWESHVPLTYLTDKGCMLKNKTSAALQDILSYDSTTGQVVTTSKALNESGELDLSFDEWMQAWRRLLQLIETHLPQELPHWTTHYSFILNSDNRSEMWPLYLAYDVEIRKRATISSIDPSKFSFGIWNDLEIRYSHKKVLSMLQADLRQHPDRFSFHNLPTTSAHTPRNQFHPPPFQAQQHQQHTLPDNPRVGRCIFCGDRSKSHPSRLCVAACYSNGSPCYLTRQEPTGARISKTGKRYCYAWNGPVGCEKNPCRRGDHSCTLCGSPTHNAQQCDAAP